MTAAEQPEPRPHVSSAGAKGVIYETTGILIFVASVVAAYYAYRFLHAPRYSYPTVDHALAADRAGARR